MKRAASLNIQKSVFIGTTDIKKAILFSKNGYQTWGGGMKNFRFSYLIIFYTAYKL